MSYLYQDNKQIINDIITRKEFYWNKKWGNQKESKYKDIIPNFILEDAISNNGNLRLTSYQLFTQNKKHGLFRVIRCFFVCLVICVCVCIHVCIHPLPSVCTDS